jgi:CspA family cold shock protein
MTYTGTVIFFKQNSPCFGFIDWSIDGEKQKDLFVHFSDIDMPGYKNLKAGQQVSFELGTNNNGLPKAISVKAV